jgi:hypothetical protein
MKRAVRFLGILFLVLLVAGALAYWGFHYYLHSGKGAQAVARHLEKTLGGRVRVGAVDVGVTASSARGVEVFAHDADTEDGPWLTIEDIEADVPVFDLLDRTARPTKVTVRGLAVRLDFDKDGHLLTKLPSREGAPQNIPEVHLERGRLTLKQAGRKPFVIAGADGTLRQKDDQVVYTGTVADPTLGDWSVEGTLTRPDNVGTLTLKSARKLHVTQAQLEALPLISPNVWKQVQVEGDTPVEVTFRSSKEAEGLRYRVALELEATKVHVSSIDLDADQARGKVFIEDTIVELNDVRGRVADGELVTTAHLDFTGPTSELDFKLAARRLDVQRLPKSWKFPPNITGRLSGDAKLHVAVTETEVRTSGTGEGVIADARVAGMPTKEPIRLRLHAEGPGFRFATPPAGEGGAALTALSVLLPALQAPSEPPPATFWPTEAVNALHTGLARGLEAVVRAGRNLVARLLEPKPPAPRPPPAKPPTNYLEVNFGLEDVDLEQLLKGLNVPVPFPITGRITFQVQAAIPLDTPRDLKTYRFKGTANLPRVRLSGMGLADVRARVVYANGILQLEELRGRLPALGSDPKAGQFQGNARLEVVPAGDVMAHLTMAGVPLAQAIRLSPGGSAPISADGRFDIRADLTGKLSPLRWSATGTAEASDLRLEGFRASSVKVRWAADPERFRLLDLHATLYEGELSGSGVIPFPATQPGNLDLHFKDLDVAGLTRDVPAIPVRLEGRANGILKATLPPAAPGQSRQITTNLEMRAERLRVQGIPAESLTGTASYRDGTTEYRLEGRTLGGRFHLDGTIPSARPKPPAQPPPEGHLRIEGAQLSRLWAALAGQSQPGPLHGTLDLTLTFRHEGPDGDAVGTGRIVLSRVRYGDTEIFSSLRGDVRLAAGELRFPELSGALGEGLVRLRAVLNLRQPGRGWFTLDLDRVEAARLLAPWYKPDAQARASLAGASGLSAPIQGTIDVRIRGNLGREWTGSGDFALVRGKVLGAEVSEWRVPFGWSFAPGVGRGYVDVQDTSAQVGRGRAQGRINFGWGYGSRLEGQIRFFNVDVQTLLRSDNDLSQIGSGLLSGRLDLGGQEIRSLDDVTATLDATLAQTQALEMPVLRQLAPYILPGRSSNAIFRSGTLRGRLARGVFRIQRLSLEGTYGQLFVEGTISLQGRLNLDVLATTTNLGPSTPALRLLGLRVPAVGPLPLSLALEARNYLSNRLIHLRVTGTVRSPTITIEPLSLLTEEALRYFLNRANVPLP